MPQFDPPTIGSSRENSLVTIFDAPAAKLDASWRRCVDRYQLDRNGKPNIVVMTSQELDEHCEPLDQTLAVAREELDYIADPLAKAGFIASLSNMAGVILHYLTAPTCDVDIERAGAIWAEGMAGTNGVGTCVIERRPVDVGGVHHFFREFSNLSCTTSPVLAPDAAMIGVLNFATAKPDLDAQTFGLMSSLVRRVAERLSDRLFRMNFGESYLLSSRIAGQGPMLLALDKDQAIVGANHAARVRFGWGEGPLKPKDLWSVFDRDVDAMSRASRTGGELKLSGNGVERIFNLDLPNKRLSAAPASRRSRKVIDAVVEEEAAAAAYRAAVTGGQPGIEECIGSGPQAQKQLALLRRVFGRGLPLLVLGETGSGKDTLARALHAESNRAGQPYIAFNCAAVPESLIDSELFGYNVGAFTGARREGSPGRFIEADGGTLFLDEIGDMQLSLQTRLLRVLESGEVSPLGGGKTRTVDVQIIAATNQDLKRRIAEGTFREDLYYRLAGVVVNLQPLHMRSDFEVLVNRMLQRMHPAAHSPLLSIEALTLLSRYRWPGNIRELKFVLQRAAQICEDGIIRPDDLMLEDELEVPETRLDRASNADLATTTRASIEAAECAAIVAALSKFGGDIMKTATALRISRATLYRKMRQYSLRHQRSVNRGESGQSLAESVSLGSIYDH